MNTENKKLYRSRDDQKIAGNCGIALDCECTDLLVRGKGYRQEIEYMISIHLV